MQLFLMLALIAACLPIDWPAPIAHLSRDGSLILLVCSLSVQLGLAAALTFIARVQLLNEPGKQQSILSHYGLARTCYFFVNLGIYACNLVFFGWGWVVQQNCMIPWGENQIFLPFGEILILAPFFIAHLGSWLIFFEFDRIILASKIANQGDHPAWTRGAYVIFLFRQHALIVLFPVFLMIIQESLQRCLPEIYQTQWFQIASYFSLPVLALFFPMVVPKLLGLKPLPAGSVRSRMERNAKRLDFRYSQIFLWPTRGSVANAMILGLIPQIRYVVFTDRLLQELNEHEVDAVFGHEMGHARHYHPLYYLFFLYMSVTCLAAALQLLLPEENPLDSKYRSLILVVPVALTAFYLFAVFGFLSRRCERQADIFGCKAVSCGHFDCASHDESTQYPAGGHALCRTGIHIFMHSLARVKDLNGLDNPSDRQARSTILGKCTGLLKKASSWLQTWQHATINERILFLEQMAQHPEIERKFQIRLLWLRCFIAAVLIGFLAWLLIFHDFDFF